jgi:sugar phosphate isomerase/epimerase
MNRRQFLQAAAGVIVWDRTTARAAERGEKSMAVNWSIGCFNRPWGRWSYEAALDGIKAAGYHLTGIVGGHKGEAFISAEATPEYLDALKQRITSRGLTVIMAWMPTRHDVPIEECIRNAHQQIDNAARLGLKYVLSGGVGREDQYEHYYRVMADCAAYAQARHIQLVLKPHGGCSASADEILRCIEKVNHPNFRVWYDAGNIIHYTGKDPVADVERVAHLVTGFCAKDCAQLRGEVMIQFGEGKVDFKGVFSKLKAAGFKGPVMVECCGGQTLEEVTAKARENREFLERLLASL